MKKPTLQELEAQCAKTGLPKSEAQDFMNYFESIGWVIGKSRHPMVSWTHALANWKRNQERWFGPKSPIAGAQKPIPSVFNLKTIIEAKEAQAKALKDAHCVDGPLTNEWSPISKRAEFAALRQEIKALRAQLAGLL